MRILFGATILLASLALSKAGYPISGILGGLIGFYFMFTK